MSKAVKGKDGKGGWSADVVGRWNGGWRIGETLKATPTETY